MDIQNTPPQPAGLTGQPPYFQPERSTAETVRDARGLSEKVRQRALNAASEISAIASAIEQQTERCDSLFNQIGSQRHALEAGEQRLAAFVEQLGGDPAVALAHQIEALVNGFTIGSSIRVGDVLGLGNLDALTRHREALIAEARRQWIALPKSAISMLQGELDAAAKELDRLSAKAAK